MSRAKPLNGHVVPFGGLLYPLWGSGVIHCKKVFILVFPLFIESAKPYKQWLSGQLFRHLHHHFRHFLGYSVISSVLSTDILSLFWQSNNDSVKPNITTDKLYIAYIPSTCRLFRH